MNILVLWKLSAPLSNGLQALTTYIWITQTLLQGVLDTAWKKSRQKVAAATCRVTVGAVPASATWKGCTGIREHQNHVSWKHGMWWCHAGWTGALRALLVLYRQQCLMEMLLFLVGRQCPTAEKLNPRICQSARLLEQAGWFCLRSMLCALLCYCISLQNEERPGEGLSIVRNTTLKASLGDISTGDRVRGILGCRASRHHPILLPAADAAQRHCWGWRLAASRQGWPQRSKEEKWFFIGETQLLRHW